MHIKALQVLFNWNFIIDKLFFDIRRKKTKTKIRNKNRENVERI